MPINFENELSDFLDALDEWGCECNKERAKAILDFQMGGYDLSEYLEDQPKRKTS